MDAKVIAAQLWCKPEHSHKEMDVAFAQSIAEAIAAARLAGKVEGLQEALRIGEEVAKECRYPEDEGGAILDAIDARIAIAVWATATDSASHSSEAESARPQPSEEPSA